MFFDQDAGRFCLRVADNVGQGFLHDAIECGFQFTRQSFFQLNDNIHRDFVARLPFMRQAFQRGGKPQIIENARAQAHGQFVDFVQRFRGHLAQVGGFGGRGALRAVGFHQAQADDQRGQTLGGGIVQFPCNTSAFILLRGNHFFEQLAAQDFAFAAQFVGVRQFFGHGVKGRGKVADFIIRPARHAP